MTHTNGDPHHDSVSRPIFLPPEQPRKTESDRADDRRDPGAEKDGKKGVFILAGRDDEVIRLRGRLLGFASSRRAGHDHDVSYDAQGRPLSFVPPGERCSACRWFEVRIFTVECELSGGTCTCGRGDLSRAELQALSVAQRVEDPEEHDETCGELDRRGRYLVLTAGKTIVPGEVEMRRAEWTNSAYEVIELLTQRRRDSKTGATDPFLPAPSARVLSRAAAWDEGIRDAYINRAVV